jgi:hypothetical protein
MKDPFYNRPWAPGYALPPYVRKEDPLTRGDAVTTPWLARGTISNVKGLDKRAAGYSLPQYLLDEPVGSQAHTTPWIPRGTVMSMKGIKTGLPWVSNAHTLDSNGLGALGASDNKGKAPVGGADPIDQYGKKVSAAILADIKAFPPDQQEARIRAIMDAIDPALYASFKKKKEHLKNVGTPAAQAAPRAIAATFSQGLTGEFMRLGRKKKVPAPGIRKGQVPLAAFMGFEAQANNYQHGALGGVLDDIKGVVSKIGGFACDVATHPVTPLAAGTAGAFQAGPTGAATATAGAGLAAAACSSGAGGGVFIPQQQGMPSWALPAILGGGALALILILR